MWWRLAAVLWASCEMGFGSGLTLVLHSKLQREREREDERERLVGRGGAVKFTSYSSSNVYSNILITKNASQHKTPECA